MASDAFDQLEKRMDAAKEAEIAAYIMRDVDLRQQNAQESGVLAYGRKPVPRGRPNERFLQNTLKSVGFANRKAVEDEMWEKWNRRKQGGKQKGASTGADLKPRKDKRKRRESSAESDSLSSASGSSHTASLSDSDTRASEGQASIDEVLTRRAVRGRGASGSRIDDAGPFLFPTDAQEREEYDMLRYAAKCAKGPECPTWIRAANVEEDDPGPEKDSTQVAAAQARKQQKRLRKERKAKKKAKKLKREKRRQRRLERSTG